MQFLISPEPQICCTITLVDLKFSGDKPDFRQLFAFAPEKLAKELKHFKYDGLLDFTGTVKGKLNK